MTDSVSQTSVERVDDRLGLAVERVILSSRTLVTYTRDHVVVRTPSHPHDARGNTLDIVDVPPVDALPTWVKRFHDTVGMLGATTVRLRMETPAGARLPDALTDWFAAQNFTVTKRTVFLANAATPVGRVHSDIRLLGDAPVGHDMMQDRMWFAADVLDKYRRGNTVDAYVPRDDTEYTETAEVLREHVIAKRARVFVAYRYGTPVGRIAATHDRQGLVVIHALVVHPVHRRKGFGTALLSAALAGYEQHTPKVRFGVSVEKGSPVAAMLEREHFWPHAEVVTAERAP